MNDVSVPPPMKTQKTVVLVAVLSVFLSVFGFFSIFSLAPFIYTYYRHGLRVCVQAAVLGVILLAVYLIGAEMMRGDDVVSIPDIGVSIESDGNEVQLNDSANDFSDTNLMMHNVNGVLSSSEIVFYTTFEFALRVVGILCFLYFSIFSWTIRLIMAIILFCVGALPSLFAAKEILFSFIGQLFTTFQVSGADESFVLQNQDLVIMGVAPLSSAMVLLLNFFIATTMLSIRAKVVPSLYYGFVLEKMIREQKKVSFILGALVLFAFFTQNVESKVIHWFYLLLVFGISLLLICKLLTGMALVFQRLQYKMSISAGWYFFLNFIIMIVPVLNFVVLLSYVLLGILLDIKKQRIKGD